MRRSILAGASIGILMAMGTVSMPVTPERQAPVVETQKVERKRRRREAAAPSYRWWRQPRPAHVATKRHTGAGGAGVHAAWKKRRASGRA